VKRWPLIPTLIVALAIAAMIALGVWQLQRRQVKEAAIARYAQNVNLPEVAFPRPPIGDENLFRKASAYCLRVIAWRSESGRSATGTRGWRQIAECATGGAEGPGLIVQFGVAKDPKAKPAFAGGEVHGFVSHAPNHRPIFADIFSHTPKQLMLVATTPPPGLEANPGPDLSGVPNNHLAYAVQWFLFAAIAGVIYWLALRRRQR
jgi:surfeit locus 1 family protein